MSFCNISDERFIFKKPATGPHLGPGTYDYPPNGDKKAELLKERLSRNRAAFSSQEPKNTSSYIQLNYTPGPGLYTVKPRQNFGTEFIKSDDDQSMYYVVSNGNIVRKV
jgi:malic enzyme